MGFRARRSFKVAPGVRVNVSKSGIGASVGTRGARYSVHSSGRTTRSVGIPGTGVGYVSSSGGGRSRSRSTSASHQTAAPAAPPAAPRPGIFASKGEKALYRLVKAGNLNVAELDTIAGQHAEQWLAASTLTALQLVAGGDTSDGTVTRLRNVFGYATPPESDPFLTKYLAGASMTISIAPGVTAQLPFSRDLVGLALGEVLQDRGRLDEAIDVVEQVTPTAHAAVSLAELYSAAGRDDDVLELTNGVSNEDDTTALLLVYRGIAFTRQGLCEAAREAFKEALKSKKRAPGIRHLALRHRAEAYAADGKKAQARKDLQRILAEDASIAGVRERLDELTQS